MDTVIVVEDEDVSVVLVSFIAEEVSAIGEGVVEDSPK